MECGKYVGSSPLSWKHDGDLEFKLTSSQQQSCNTVLLYPTGAGAANSSMVLQTEKDDVSSLHIFSFFSSTNPHLVFLENNKILITKKYYVHQSRLDQVAEESMYVTSVRLCSIKIVTFLAHAYEISKTLIYIIL